MDDAERTIRAAWARLGAAPTDHRLKHLLHCYRQPHRHYHTTQHLAAVLSTIADVEARLGDDEQCDVHAVLLAALFHDIVYEPMHADNEAASAELAAQCAQHLGWSPARCADVHRLVLATATHRAGSPDEALLLDADLAILAAPAVQYADYARAVRAEYAAVPDQRWRRGRAEVLGRLLALPNLYSTRYMRQHAETSARGNLAAELATLTDS